MSARVKQTFELNLFNRSAFTINFIKITDSIEEIKASAHHRSNSVILICVSFENIDSARVSLIVWYN
jgi:hypothetical protein